MLNDQLRARKLRRKRRLTSMESLEDRRVLAAMLQVVHNSPYEAAAVVDVYVNDDLLLDDFAFRDASPFVEVPSGVELKIDITAADAPDNIVPVFSTTVTLGDANYIAMAAGDPLGSEGQPGFDLAVTDIGQKTAIRSIDVDALVFHGSPDAPAVDVVARSIGPIVDNLSFPEFDDDYVSLVPAAYVLDITPAEDNSTVVASFEADLSAAAGGAVVIAASGFLAPPTETDPSFGLLAVFPDGTTALLPAADAPTGRLQVIHNSPYAAASEVDVYANDELLLDNFAFRDASPFVDVPAFVDIKLDITAADAGDNSAPVFSTVVNLGTETYVAMAVGDPLASEGDTAFGLAVTDAGQESSITGSSPNVLVAHGVPDAPEVDVIARDLFTLADDIAYPEFNDHYSLLPPVHVTLDVTTADNETFVASFEADLRGAAGQALVVTASGFLTPDSATDPIFGLLAVFPDGTTALLPRTVQQTARLQVVHNSPYAAAEVVDVYANGDLLLDDFAFRTASPFVDVPANVPVIIDVAAPDSSDNSAPLFTQTLYLQNRTYVAMAVGDPLGTEGQPAFDLAISDMGQEAAGDPANVDAMVFHGSPDAPAVDVIARDVDKLVDDLSYPEFTDGYLSLPPASYTLDVTLADDNSAVVGSFEADLSAAAGGAVVVAASGFVAPAAETDPAFGLLAVFPDGTTALLPTVAGPPARVQIVHNSPYLAAAVVDVYVNDVLLLDDLAFREASSFVDVPADVDVKIDITAPDADDNSSPVFSTTVNLKNTTYVAMAVGDPLAGEGQPAFDLVVTDMGREAANDPAEVDAIIFHGSPDAPTVDIFARGIGLIVDDISFPEFTEDYLSVTPAVFTLDITPAINNALVVATFDADVSEAAGAALVVAASGFLAPPTALDPAFGLLAVFADGTTALLPMGSAAPEPGDSNGDGKFDEADLALVAEAGKYETGDEATFEEGDWNRDEIFSTGDFVDVFRIGNYVGGQAAAVAAIERLFSSELADLVADIIS